LLKTEGIKYKKYFFSQNQNIFPKLLWSSVKLNKKAYMGYE